MHDPIAAGRRSALRAVAVQALVAALVGFAYLSQGVRPALAATAGGGALVAGTLLSTLCALGGGVRSAGAALTRALVGALGKWWVVMAGLVMALGVWRLPAVPVLVGLAAGLVAHSVGMIVASNRNR